MPDRPVGASVGIPVDGQADSTGPAADAGSAGLGGRATRARQRGAWGVLTRLAGSRPVRWGFVAATVALGSYAVASNWPAVQKDLGRLGFAAVALAMVCVLAALLALMQLYRVLLAALGSPLPPRAAAQILFVGNLGKYLPGSVWPVLAQMELGTDHAVPRRRSASASVLTMLLSLLTGIVVGLLALPFSSGAARYWWVFLVAPVILVCLYPKVLNRVLDRLLTLARRPALEQPLTGRAVATAFGWGVALWICYGLQIWVMADRLGAHGGAGLLLSIGGFALAWCAGFLFILAPAGAGVREIVLIAVLGPVITAPAAGVVALVSRLLLTVGDLVSAAVAALLARRPPAG